VQVVFHGLTLLVLPDDKSKPYADVAFINTRLNPDLKVYHHAPTLKIDKELVHAASTAIPAASDLDSAYYSLDGPVRFVPTDHADPAESANPSNENLTWNDVALTDKNPADCAKGNVWNNLAWVLDFKELDARARMPAGWQSDRTRALGWVRLSNGFLETDQVPADNGDKFRYTVNGAERLLKDRIRYAMPSSVPYLQVRFGEGAATTSLIVPCGAATSVRSFDVFHLATPAMDPNPPNGPLMDYYAMYEVLLTRDELKKYATVASRPTLSNRRGSCHGLTPKSGNCAGIRI